MPVLVNDEGVPMKQISPRMKAARDKLEAMFKPIHEGLSKYGIPDDKMDRIIDYAMKTMVDQPQMKPDRVIRKTVEFYKLQLLVEDEAD